uniref:Zinc finger matrin-type protein CG9776 n=1 Tax=Cacopsylla melanoneura TaxID=428564 RepID=A0A8D9FC98_9HEMI
MFRYLGVNQVRNIDSLYSGENIEINRNLTGGDKKDETGAVNPSGSEEAKGNKSEESSSRKTRSHSSERRSSHSNHKRDDHYKSSSHHSSSHKTSSSHNSSSNRSHRYQHQLALDKFNRFRRSVSVEPSAYRKSQQRSFIQKQPLGGPAYYRGGGGRRKNKIQRERGGGGGWGEKRYGENRRGGKRGGFTRGGRGRRRQNSRNNMMMSHEDEDAMDLEMPPPPNQHFRHNMHNSNNCFKPPNSFNSRPPLLPLPNMPPPPPASMLMPPPPPPPLVYELPPPSLGSTSSSNEALKKEKLEHNRMLAEKRDEHLTREKSLYEDLRMLQRERAKELKKHGSKNKKILIGNEDLQDEIRKKIESTRSAIQMLTDIIGDHMKHSVPQLPRRTSSSSSPLHHKSDSSSDSSDNDYTKDEDDSLSSDSLSSSASEAASPPSSAQAQQGGGFVKPNRRPPKRYNISRNRNIFVRRRDITTRDRRKIDTTAFIQTAGQAVLKSHQQETLEEKSQKLEAKLHACDDTDGEDIFPLASAVGKPKQDTGAASRERERSMEEDIEDIFNLRPTMKTRKEEDERKTNEAEEEREEETVNKVPRRKSPTTIIEEIILDGNEDLGMLLTKPDQEQVSRRQNIQITLKKRDKRNKVTEEEKREKSTGEEIGAVSKEEVGTSQEVGQEETLKEDTGKDPASAAASDAEDKENRTCDSEMLTVANERNKQDKLEVFWCQSCNLDFARDVDYLNHLQSPLHANNSQKEQPWLADLSPATPSLPPPNRLHEICLGAHWLIPVHAWYCRLCRECYADVRLAAGHIQGVPHCHKVQNHSVQNPLWEITLLKARTEAAQRKLNSNEQLEPSTEQLTSNLSESTASCSEETKQGDPTSCQEPKQGHTDGKNETEQPENSPVKTKPRNEIFEDEDTREGGSGEKSKLWVPNRKAFDKMNKPTQQDVVSKKKPSFIGKMPSGGTKGKIKINLPPAQGTSEVSEHDTTALPGGENNNLVANVGNILSQLDTIYRNEQESWELSQEREILAAEREIARQRLLDQQTEETQDETIGQSSDEDGSKQSTRSRSESSRQASSRCSSPGSRSSQDSNNTSKLFRNTNARSRNTNKRTELSNNRHSRDSSRSSIEDDGSKPANDLDVKIPNVKSNHSKPTLSKHSNKFNLASLPKSNNISTRRSHNTSSISKGSAQAIDSESEPAKYINFHYDVDSSEESESQDHSARQILNERKAWGSAYSSSEESAPAGLEGLDEAELRNRRYLSLMKKYVRRKERENLSERGARDRLLRPQDRRNNQQTQSRNQRVSQQKNQKMKEQVRSRRRVHAYRKENNDYDEEFDSEGIEKRVSISYDDKHIEERDGYESEDSEDVENDGRGAQLIESASINTSRTPTRSIAEDSQSPLIPRTSISRQSHLRDKELSRHSADSRNIVSHRRSMSPLDIDFISETRDRQADQSIGESVGGYFESNQHRNHISTFLGHVPDNTLGSVEPDADDDVRSNQDCDRSWETDKKSLRGEADDDTCDRSRQDLPLKLSDEEHDGQTGLSDRVETIMRRQKGQKGLSESSSEKEQEVAYMSDSGEGSSEYEEKSNEVEEYNETCENTNQATREHSKASVHDEKSENPIGFKGAIFFNNKEAEVKVQLPFLSEEDPTRTQPAGDVYEDCEQLRSKLEQVKENLRSQTEGKKYSSFQDAFRDHRERYAIQMRQQRERKEEEDGFATTFRRNDDWSEREEEAWQDGNLERREEGVHYEETKEERMGTEVVSYQERGQAYHPPRELETPVGAMFTRNRRKSRASYNEQGGASDEESCQSFDTGSSKRKRVNKYLEEEERLKSLGETDNGEVEEKWRGEEEVKGTLGEETGHVVEARHSERKVKRRKLGEENQNEYSEYEQDKILRQMQEEEELFRQLQEKQVQVLKEAEKRLQLEKEEQEKLRDYLMEKKRHLEIVKARQSVSRYDTPTQGDYLMDKKTEEARQSVSRSQSRLDTQPIQIPVRSRRCLQGNVDRFRFATKISDTDCSELIDPTIDTMYSVSAKQHALGVSHCIVDSYPTRSEFVNFALRHSAAIPREDTQSRLGSRQETAHLVRGSSGKTAPVTSLLHGGKQVNVPQNTSRPVHPSTHFQPIDSKRQVAEEYDPCDVTVGKTKRDLEKDMLSRKKRKIRSTNLLVEKRSRPESAHSLLSQREGTSYDSEADERLSSTREDKRTLHRRLSAQDPASPSRIFSSTNSSRKFRNSERKIRTSTPSSSVISDSLTELQYLTSVNPVSVFEPLPELLQTDQEMPMEANRRSRRDHQRLQKSDSVSQQNQLNQLKGKALDAELNAQQHLLSQEAVRSASVQSSPRLPVFEELSQRLARSRGGADTLVTESDTPEYAFQKKDQETEFAQGVKHKDLRTGQPVGGETARGRRLDEFRDRSQSRSRSDSLQPSPTEQSRSCLDAGKVPSQLSRVSSQSNLFKGPPTPSNLSKLAERSPLDRASQSRVKDNAEFTRPLQPSRDRSRSRSISRSNLTKVPSRSNLMDTSYGDEELFPSYQIPTGVRKGSSQQAQGRSFDTGRESSLARSESKDSLSGKSRDASRSRDPSAIRKLQKTPSTNDDDGRALSAESRNRLVGRDTREMMSGGGNTPMNRSISRDMSVDRSSVVPRDDNKQTGRSDLRPEMPVGRNTQRETSVDRIEQSRETSVDRIAQNRESSIGRLAQSRETSVDRKTGKVNRELSVDRMAAQSTDGEMSSDGNFKPGPSRESTIAILSPKPISKAPRLSPKTNHLDRRQAKQPSQSLSLSSQSEPKQSVSPLGESQQREKDTSDLIKTDGELENKLNQVKRIPSNPLQCQETEEGRAGNQVESERTRVNLIERTSKIDTKPERRDVKDLKTDPEKQKRKSAADIEMEKRQLAARLQELEREIKKSKQMQENIQKREQIIKTDVTGKTETTPDRRMGPHKFQVPTNQNKRNIEPSRQSNMERQDTIQGESRGFDAYVGNIESQADVKGEPSNHVEQDTFDTNTDTNPVKQETKPDPALFCQPKIEPGTNNPYYNGPSGQTAKVKSEDDELSSGSRENYDPTDNVQMTQYVSSQVTQADGATTGSAPSTVGQSVTPPLFIPGIFIKSNEQFVVKSSTIYKKKTMSKRRRMKKKMARFSEQQQQQQHQKQQGVEGEEGEGV